MAKAAVELMSLVGARTNPNSSATMPKRIPIQFEKRIIRKKVIKKEKCFWDAFPPTSSIKSCNPPRLHSAKFWKPVGMNFIVNLNTTASVISTAITIHIVIMVLVTGKPASSKRVFGARCISRSAIPNAEELKEIRAHENHT